MLAPSLPLSEVSVPAPPPEGPSAAERGIFRTSRVLLALLAAMFVVSLVAQKYGVGVTPYKFRLSSVGFDLIMNAGFIGMALLYNRLGRPLGEQAAVVALAAAVEGFLWTSRPSNWGWTGAAMTVGIGVGLAAMAGMAAHLFARDATLRERARGYLVISLFMVLFPSVSLWAHFVVMELNPQVFDLFAFQVDGLPGFQPSFMVGQFLSQQPLLLSLALVIYNELPLLLIVAIVLVLDHPRRSYNDVILSFALMGLAGFLLYNLYPAVGLGVLCKGDFPAGTPPEFPDEPFLMSLWGPRNCMPSLHMSWILCLWFGVFRISRPVMVGAAVAVGFTVLSTLYLGHYWIDLVAAFPLALLFQGITAWRRPGNGPARAQAIAVGGGLLAFCMGILRWGHPALVAVPALTLLGEAALIAVCLWTEARLARASLDPAPPREPLEPVLEAAV